MWFPFRRLRFAPRLRPTAVVSARRFRPRLEVLEDRQLLSSFLVVLGTDNGGPIGQKVTATSGDLRYCVEQADATHTATADSIGFSSMLTTTPHTITLSSVGPLVLSDSHPLSINGPAALTLNISGGNKVEVFDIVSSTVTIKNLAIIYGNAGNALGGGISNHGTLTLSNCFLDHDSSTSGYGGGISNAGNATLSKCTLYLDSAVLGGGIYNQGFTTLATVTLANCTISNDSASIDGGGIDNESGDLIATNCTIANDTASASGLGGGMFNGDTATLTNCTLRNDTAQVGGGIFNEGRVTLIGCTLSNDVSTNNEAGFSGCGGILAGNSATLTNCTLANDSAANYGGGIYIDSSATVTLTNCTISNDSAAIDGGGIDNAGGTLNLTNTIVAGNMAGTSGPDLFGAVTTADHDLVGDATGSSGITNGVGGNIVGGNGNPVIDARLGPLENNGGPTETMALLADSPAIGHADNTMAPLTDQRGHTRIDELGETTDIGAFEL